MAHNSPDVSFDQASKVRCQPIKKRMDSDFSVAIGGEARPTGRNVSTARREVRKLNTQNMYKSWQKAYRSAIKERPDMSDIWYSQHIAKMQIAKKRNAETIRKHMKS